MSRKLILHELIDLSHDSHIFSYRKKVWTPPTLQSLKTITPFLANVLTLYPLKSQQVKIALKISIPNFLKTLIFQKLNFANAWKCSHRYNNPFKADKIQKLWAYFKSKILRILLQEALCNEHDFEIYTTNPIYISMKQITWNWIKYEIFFS